MLVPAHRDAIASLVEFCTAYPLSAHGSLSAARLLGELATTDDCLLDLWEGTERIAVAVVLDQLQNLDDAVIMEILAAPQLQEAGFLEMLAQAEQIWARSGRKALSLQIPEKWSPFGRVLLGLAWTAERDSLSMTRENTPIAFPLPADVRWRDLGSADVLAYHRLLHAAFAEDAGIQMPDMAGFKKNTLNREIPIRLLIHRGRPIAFVRVARQGDLGNIETIGRHPSWRGRKIGPLLLAEAQRLLADCSSLRLEVQGNNLPARRLYTRYGFTPIERWITYLKRQPLL